MERENRIISVSAAKSQVSAVMVYSKIAGKAEERMFEVQSYDVGSIIKRWKARMAQDLLGFKECN